MSERDLASEVHWASERHWADRFCRDVDDLLCKAGRMECEPLSAEYRQVVGIARTLATTDFSVESQVRQPLRRRLFDQVDVPRGWQQKAVRGLRSLFEPSRLTVKAAAMILMGFIVMSVAWPGASSTLAQSIRASVQQLVLGQHTTVTQTACPDEQATVAIGAHSVRGTPVASAVSNLAQSDAVVADAVVASTGGEVAGAVAGEDNLCIINTVIGRFGFHLPSESDAVARSFSTLDEARGVVPFRLRQPGYLPDGYVLRETLVAPGGAAFLFYEGQKGDVILVQISVGLQPGDDLQSVQATAVEILTCGTIEPVTLNDVPAGWVEGHGLMWEADGISYTVGGVNLSLGEAMRIAESLE